MIETNKPIRDMSTIELDLKIGKLKTTVNGLHILVLTSFAFAFSGPQIGSAISDKNIPSILTTVSSSVSANSIIITGVASFVAGVSAATILNKSSQISVLEEELEYRNSNPEEQPKVYQKEINHTR